jgi:uncharacterized protein DUF6328
MDERQRTERQMAELLQELRVALPGVQILFAFLLTVPFTQGFSRVTAFQKNLFYGVLLATAASTVLLIAPTATHRLRFHKRDRKYVIESAHRLTIAGLVCLAVAIVGAVLLITDFLFGLGGQWYWPLGLALLLVALWFVRPLARSDSSGP